MIYEFRNVTNEQISAGIDAIKAEGGEIDESSFSIHGVSGTYEVEGSDLVIDIQDKPWMATWGMIEAKLNEFFKRV